MFLAASIINLHITSAYVHPVQPLATILNICTWNKQDTNSSDKHIELAHFDYDLTFRMYSTYIFKSNR